MALEADNPNSFTVIPTNEVFILQNPIMVYDDDSDSNDCTIIFDPSENLPQIVFDQNYYQIGDERFPNNSVEADRSKQLPFQFVTTEEHKVDEGLAVLEILYNNPQNDKPELIDINALTESNQLCRDVNENNNASSDDDDVIFVAEYKKSVKKNLIAVQKTSLEEDAPRRNPVRKVRNAKASRDLAKELLYEEDFVFLDQAYDDPVKSKVSYNRKQSIVMEKQWPVNVHERPEYNTKTNKIEAFDYTIRQIKNSEPQRKPSLEKKKTPKKKKYFARKRKSKEIEVEEKYPIQELSSLVNSTLSCLKTFLRNCEDRNVTKDSAEGGNVSKLRIEDYKSLLLKNQSILCSVVNNGGESDFLKLLENDSNNFTED